MQPPSEYFDIQFPNEKMTPADHLAFVVKRHKYVTIVFQHRSGVDQGPHFAVTLHQVEMKKLVRAVEAAIEAGVDPSLSLTEHGWVEGVTWAVLPNRPK